MAESDLFWDQLLQLIDSGGVVPVVGAELLVCDDGDGPIPMYRRLALALADYLDVPCEELPAGAELNEVACRYLARGNPIEDIYPAVKTVFANQAFSVPNALRQLAEIEAFDLYVTTTFDPLLKEALDQARFEGAERTEVRSYSPTEPADLAPDYEHARHPTVFHLLGKLSATPLSFAVTQEDVLEFIHSLQSDARQPPLLFDRLSGRNLLILGSNFSDWLARFFFRAAKGQRLLQARGTTDYVIESQHQSDANFVLFLHHFSHGTKVSQGGSATEFVGELHRRWFARTPCTELDRPPKTDDTVSAAEGAVFLSYASEDQDAVEQIRTGLAAIGVDVFFDKSDLEAGDDFELRLSRTIGECSLFLPVISRHTLTGQRRFFRVEWDQAIEESRKVAPSERFIMPIVIDDTSPEESRLPERFCKLHWQSLPDGQPNAEFLGLVQTLYRRYQKALHTS